MAATVIVQNKWWHPTPDDLIPVWSPIECSPDLSLLFCPDLGEGNPTAWYGYSSWENFPIPGGVILRMTHWHGQPPQGTDGVWTYCIRSAATVEGQPFENVGANGNCYDREITTTVPEPGTVLLMLVGIIGLLVLGWLGRK